MLTPLEVSNMQLKINIQTTCKHNYKSIRQRAWGDGTFHKHMKGQPTPCSRALLLLLRLTQSLTPGRSSPTWLGICG